MTITRIFKITIALFAILILGVIGGFATTLIAEDTDDGVISYLSEEQAK